MLFDVSSTEARPVVLSGISISGRYQLTKSSLDGRRCTLGFCYACEGSGKTSLADVRPLFLESADCGPFPGDDEITLYFTVSDFRAVPSGRLCTAPAASIGFTVQHLGAMWDIGGCRRRPISSRG